MSQNTVSSLTSEITRRQEELAKLQALLEELKSEPYEYQLARQLHSQFCRWNHTDGCGWFYESKDGIENWNGHAHAEYLGKARKLIHKCEAHEVSIDFALGVVAILKE